MENLTTKRESNIILSFSQLNLEKMPSYVTSSISDIEVRNPLQDVYEIRDSIVVGLMTGIVMAYRENNFAIRFKELASQIEEDCILLSSPSQIALHPAYQKIIGMGEKIIPLLIEKLNSTPTIWFWALESITGINPVPKVHRGDVSLMIEDWQNWFNESKYGKTKGFIY